MLLSLPALSTHNLRGDLAGGLTAAIVALPLALAFGVASGAGPVAGLYGAICVGLFAALFGGTPSQVSGPTGPMTVVSATVFTQYAAEPALAFTVVMLSGLFQILFGYLRLGRYVNLLPYPVISGFMTGIGCILIIMQVDPALGYAAPATVASALTVLPGYLSSPNIHAVTIAITALAVVTLTPRRIGRVVPTPLLALVAGSLLAVTALSDAPVLGAVPSSLPVFRMPSFEISELNDMLVSAAVLGALGSIDSLLTSLVADNLTRTFHESDRELVGQGIGNLVAGMLGGIPGAGATIRTMTNIRAGGRTPLSGITHALVLLAIALGLGRLVAYIPHAALAGVLIKVGIDVIDWRYLRRMFRAPRTDLVCMVVVLALTVFVDVITAVGVGVIMASLLFVREMAELQTASIRVLQSHEGDHAGLLTETESALYRQCGGRALILHMTGPISFGAANEMTRRIASVAGYDTLIVDLLDVPRLDGSAALAVEEIIRRAREQRQDVVVVGLSREVARLFGSLGVLDLIKETHRFSTRDEALREAARLIAQRQRAPQPSS